MVVGEEWDSPQALLWAARILRSHRDRLGHDLIPAGGAPREEARRLFEYAGVVLCHDGAADPRFVYANRTACRLWQLPHDRIIGMHSRLSAGPEAREERQRMLDRASASGVFTGYQGVRRAADGSLFQIADAVLWTVDDEDGSPVGQAATFTRWTPLPPDTPASGSV